MSHAQGNKKQERGWVEEEDTGGGEINTRKVYFSFPGSHHLEFSDCTPWDIGRTINLPAKVRPKKKKRYS